MGDARGARVISSLARFRRRLWSPVVNSAPAYGPDRQVCIALNGHPSLTSDLPGTQVSRDFSNVSLPVPVYTHALREDICGTLEDKGR